VLLFAALANAAVQDRPDNNGNNLHHDFQEDVHLTEFEADSKIIDLDKEEEELSRNYEDNDEDYYDEDYDENDDDEDWNWAAGDYYDLLEELLEDYHQVHIRDHGKPDNEDKTVTVAEVSPLSHNSLVSVFVASGLASLVLFTLAFVIYFCNRRSRDSSSAKQAQLPFAIQDASCSSPFQSSIIKPGKYQPVATQEEQAESQH